MDKRQLKAVERKLTARCRELQAAVQRNLSDGRAPDDRAADIGDIANTSFEKEIAFGRNASVAQHFGSRKKPSSASTTARSDTARCAKTKSVRSGC